ncbi:MAG: ABC transporter ATP-binding protein [Burkholderiaceae bacterium]|nr:ABC transporter ATP-binding protein [Burkholderiaceae bacterium]
MSALQPALAAVPSAAPRSVQPLLSLDDVAFGYRDKPPILEHFDLAVDDGQFVALLGPSGCGKTTVMNLVAGFLSPRAGRVRFGGAAVDGPNTSVAYMTQGDTLLPWRRVADNVALPLELRGVKPDTIRARVEAMLRLVHLQDAAHLYPAELSGGMKRRALLARSLAYDPQMLLMDEPFAALDAQLRETMHKELLAMMGSYRRSVLFVTHDIAESISLADRIVLFKDKPARIAEDVAVPFGKNRNLDEVRESDEYVYLERQLRTALATH